MSEEKYSSRVTSPTGSETSEAAAGRKYIFIRSGVRTSELLDTARFPPQYQYTVTGRVRKRGSHGQIGKLVQLNGYNIAIFRHAKLLYAINDKCSHLGGSLSHGDIEDIDGRLCVSCPRHGYCFELRSGDLVVPESQAGLSQDIFPLRIEPDGEISVGFLQLDAKLFSGDEDF